MTAYPRGLQRGITRAIPTSQNTGGGQSRGLQEGRGESILNLQTPWGEGSCFLSNSRLSMGVFLPQKHGLLQSSAMLAPPNAHTLYPGVGGLV